VGLRVLQHPRERHAWKNTARLLALCVADTQWAQAERVDRCPWPTAGAHAAADADADPGPYVLLYPPTPGDGAIVPPPALPWDPASSTTPPGVRLVVIDATWRKAYRMLAESPWLQSLPRWSLAVAPPSRYGVRRARGAQQRSTFEAAALALAGLNGPDWPLPRLMAVFDAFNARLAGRMRASG
jgi:DTW domain-containing protein YfiP